jgi:hypothetical protein
VDRRLSEARGAILQKEVEILDKVFVDYESSIPSWDSRIVRRFFRTYNPVFTSPGLPQASAKLDARDFAQKTKRIYPQWLTPADLYESLNVRVCTHVLTTLREALTSAAIRDRTAARRRPT